jgi:hypothetical protein
MKNIVKIFGLMSIIAVIPGAMAATSRVSMISKASPRLSSFSGYITSKTKTTTGTTSYLADSDCVSNYSDCIKANDACGSDFEECTTNLLLHAKMPNCLGVLSQCSSSGVNSLFGSSNMTSITTPIKDGDDITGYTYPTSGSVLGQMVTAAQIKNQLTADQCVKKYTSCLKKDAVCGEDFELCTDNTEFKKQALSCASTLARCKNDGKSELFGSVTAAGSLKPEAGSRLSEMIKEGEKLAVNNAVATCYKVADQCILNACAKNPNKCVTDRKEILIRIADSINGGRAITNQDLTEISKLTSKRDISKYISQECQQTIGTNRYCYMTVKKVPVTKESALKDPDTVEEVFEDLYNGEYGRFDALKNKIDEIVNNFDAKIQDKCIDTMSSCAMRSCGGGVGSVCYAQSKDKNSGTVNIQKSYDEIKSACRAIVDVDPNCQYAAVLNTETLFNSFLDDKSNVFVTLFPDGTNKTDDVIGIVSYLNSLLVTSYNDAAIESLKKQCQTTALACVRSMCGKDYVNCYRNRTDVMAGTYDTGNTKFDNSMNKVGGVLDYNIVIGLCMNTIKESSVCEEHLKIAANDIFKQGKTNPYAESWQYDTTTGRSGIAKQYETVRDAWLGSNSTSVQTEFTDDVLVACRVPEGEGDDDCCSDFDTRDPINNKCDTVIDSCGCKYTEEVKQSMSDYVLDNSAKSLFQKLLVDVEREVQAKYNAKLTKEQNVCNSNNNGGVKGSNENGSTFMWVKLKTNKVPKTYTQKGLKSTEFSPSSDLYGSFCRARITVTSDDPSVQKVLSDKKYANDSVAYFAVGDSFTCGSWLSEKTLEEITKQVGKDAAAAAGRGGAKDKVAQSWATVAGFVGGGLAGYFGMDALQKNGGGALGGLVSGTSNADKDMAQKCVDSAISARAKYRTSINTSDDAKKVNLFMEALSKADEAMNYARRAGVQGIDGLEFKAPGEYKAAVNATNAYFGYETEDISNIVSYATNINCSSVSDGNLKKECENKKKNAISHANALSNTRKSAAISSTDLKATVDSKIELAKGNSAEADNVIREIKGIYAVSGYGLNDTSFVEEGSVKTTKQIGEGGTAYVAAIADSNDMAEVYGKFETSLTTLNDKCSKRANGDHDDDQKKRRNTNLIASAVTATAGGVLGYGIAKSALDVKYENIGNEAVKEWMQEIGEHIHCYLGADELGSFGDVVSIEIE